MTISIIIPTYNEAANLQQLVPYLRSKAGKDLLEIIVVDGHSTDGSLQVAAQSGAKSLLSPRRGRAAQMNHGARHASGDILYFVPADTRPPGTFAQDILSAVASGFPMGCYRFQFDSPRLMLKINAYFTRFDRLMCRGGDQTFFIQKKAFEALGGYNDEMLVMEEYDFLLRARKHYSFRIIPKNVVVSARKYETNSYLRVNLANLIVFTMFRLGCSQQRMIRFYHRMLRQPTYNHPI